MNTELRNNFIETAAAALAAGQWVKIEDVVGGGIELILHRGEDDEYVFRYDEAERIIDECTELAQEFDVELEQVLLARAQEW